MIVPDTSKKPEGRTVAFWSSTYFACRTLHNQTLVSPGRAGEELCLTLRRGLLPVSVGNTELDELREGS